VQGSVFPPSLHATASIINWYCPDGQTCGCSDVRDNIPVLRTKQSRLRTKQAGVRAKAEGVRDNEGV
jgi:hypothetical protein